MPVDKDVHLICDNYGTHKHPKVKAWQTRNPRFNFHFTPTGASWLNMVERFFRDLTTKAIKRGSFYNVEDLIGAIQEYINEHNSCPKPFIWTASANDILAKVKRARVKCACGTRDEQATGKPCVCAGQEKDRQDLLGDADPCVSGCI